MRKKRAKIIFAGCVLAAAVMIVCVIVLKNRESHPVWNEVRVNGTVIRAGQPWEEMRESLESMGLESETIGRGFVPLKEGIPIGLNIRETISEKNERVRVIFCNVEENATDFVIELAGIQADQGTYEEIRQIAGPETRKEEKEDTTIYTWTERHNQLVVCTDKEGRVLNFALHYDREGFEDEYDYLEGENTSE